MSPELLLLIVSLPLFAVLLAGLRRVPDGTAYTVRRFGRYSRTMGPGLRFALPLVESVSAPVELINHRIQLALDAGDAAGTRAAFYYQIVEPERSGDRLDDIDAWVEREARQQIDDLLASAGRDVDALRASLKQSLNERLGGLGLRVTRCQLGT